LFQPPHPRRIYKLAESTHPNDNQKHTRTKPKEKEKEKEKERKKERKQQLLNRTEKAPLLWLFLCESYWTRNNKGVT